MVSQGLVGNGLENKASIKLSVVPETIVLVGDKGDREVMMFFCRLSWAFYFRFIPGDLFRSACLVLIGAPYQPKCYSGL